MRTGAFLPHLLALALALPLLARAQWSVYHPKNPQVIFGGAAESQTATAGAAAYTGAAAYDPTTLVAPAPPNPPINTNFPVQLYTGGMTNLSIPQSGAFVGFSVEMSVATQVLGKNSTVLFVPFLNLMANIVARAGWVQVRVGGNTQESAELKDSLANGTILQKDYANALAHTGTPPLEFTDDLVYMMGNISDLTNTRWYMGIPFFNTTPYDLKLAEHAQRILGDRLIALQAGNEPDLYAQNGRNHRPEGYSPANYTAEIGGLVAQTASDADMPRKDDLWLVPSISAGSFSPDWNPDQVWATGIVDTYLEELHALASPTDRYPNNNCAAVYNTGAPIIQPQDVIGDYLRHSAPTSLVQDYVSSAAVAVAHNKPMIMFETNTASCSGFVGISDSFTGALWGLDWALTLAANNFSAALYHLGGQNSYYNPFTPPPTNQTTFRQWTIGPMYYVSLVVSEILGPSNKSQVVDLQMNGNQDETPGWAIYESGTPTKVVLMNYIDDPSGAQAYTAQISIGGGQTGQAPANPASVRVKRFSASSVTQKGNFTWAGQTFGNHFESDGRLTGELSVETIQCDQATNVCSVSVPAPGVAVVFLTDDGYDAVTPPESAVATFPTTYYTATVNTAKVDPSALASSNGHTNLGGLRGATSQGARDRSAGSRVRVEGWAAALVPAAFAVGAMAAAW
ncbi:hypothetical protein OF83DRAFT_1060198 [Amylostereum chailletii]|nr:hypothetical protein OF83DRAFT_1060198 [Amylostereum chailletii]